MLRFSKKADYALLALQFLATDGDASARAIAERYDIPVELLAKVLQHLARLGFVAAHKGAHGGYHLGRPTSAISVAEVVQAIDGPFAVTACAPGDERCAQFAACTVRDPLWRLKSRILSVLQTTTLAEIAKPKGSTVLLVNAR
jgi:Rrf2 family iron-sulfur cluster assembly transcriptional regulator